MRTSFSSVAFWFLAALSLGGCATFTVKSPLVVLEESQVFQPVKHPYPKGSWDKKYELGVENAWIVDDVANGRPQLHGWYLPHENPVGVALFAHGNTGNVSTQAETLRLLHDRHRLSVMTFDYQGYGQSEGVPSEAGILEDARRARAWLAKRENMDEKDIILIGHSLGGGVVVDLAARDGARGLILASTFSSLPDVANFYAPLLPAQKMMQNRLDSTTKIRDYHGPLLQIHGDKDTVIPYRLGKKLFDAANQPKVFVTKTGADHNDPMSEAERQAIDKFLTTLPAPQHVNEVAAHDPRSNSDELAPTEDNRQLSLADADDSL